MLRRPPTTLTLTAEDVAAYEDRRFAAAQSQAQTDSRATSHPLLPQQQQQPQPMDMSSPSLAPSSPPAGDDEDMQDADAEDPDTSDPFLGPRRAAREQFSGRETSPGAQRAAYLQQMRATRSQQPQQITNTTSTAGHTPAPSAPSTRMQRIAGATQQAGTTRTAGTTTRSAASRQGSTEPSAVPVPPPGRMMTRSREERIGIAAPNAGTGAGTGVGSRRR
ncbi:hypothetical protein F5Y05DRAFT_392942 [Hypoxylon sp. FL0543]|nr:hypothetical protein F5Y05DRAFT_392942 [Hypoxylon sp. FL0543]